MTIRIMLSLLLALLVSEPFVSAQEKTDKSWGVPNQPLNCEMNFQNLEYLSKLAQEQRTGFLIIIARLGNLETQKELNDRRLYNVRLKLTLLGVPSDKIVVAEGERLRGLGRVEFYLRGELIGALPIPKGSDICVGCCDPDHRFYPYKRRSAVKGSHATNPSRADSMADDEVLGQ